MWRSLQEGVERLDFDARLKTRQLVIDTFSRIEVYIRGFDGTSKEHVDLLLVSRRGISRMLRIDRASGEWRGMEDVDQHSCVFARTGDMRVATLRHRTAQLPV